MCPRTLCWDPFLFILFINDMFSCISEGTTIALYACNTKICRTINYSTFHFILQNDILDKSFEWATKNLMKFHPSECKARSITYQIISVIYSIIYHLHYLIINWVLTSLIMCHVKYEDLGITVTNKLLWMMKQSSRYFHNQSNFPIGSAYANMSF